jgi:hypothetical protein
MRTGYHTESPLRVTVDGEVLLSHNHIALLHGLYDRPGGRVEYRAEWVRATAPYISRMRSHWSAWCLRGSMIRIHPQLVTQVREGRRVAATITELGRGIIERKIPARITGRGSYLGLHSVDEAAMAAEVARLADADIREAVAYSRAFGLPLLMRSVQRSGGTIYAVSNGLGQSFQLMSYEELHGRGPQSWHWEWTRATIERGIIPAAYLEHFADADPDDLLEHLQEIQETDTEALTYMRVYHGAPILSRSRIVKFLETEIDLRSTDCPGDDLTDHIRLESRVYQNALNALEDRLSWTHPDTGKLVGAAYLRESPGRVADIIVTNPEALSCLQRHFDACDVGLQLETRYRSPV